MNLPDPTTSTTSMTSSPKAQSGEESAPSAHYQLSDAQHNAIAKMAQFLQQRPRRAPFPDRAAFQRYWDRLDAACAERRLETPAQAQARRTARAAQQADYYANEEHLYAWARRYCQRYQPSQGQLRNRMLKKAGPAAPIDVVIARLDLFIDDDRRALELATRMRDLGRSARWIKGKLRQRQFDAATITHCLAMCAEATGSVWTTESATRKARQLLRKGTSQAAIRRTLIETPADATVVDAALAELFTDDLDTSTLTAAIARLQRRNVDAKTIIRRLQGKGFRYADIAAALRESGFPP